VLFDRDGPRATASGGLASLDHALAITPDTAFRADLPYARRTAVTGVLASPVMVFWNIEKK
jgi:transcriptional regulator GlxA family with amidase domain